MDNMLILTLVAVAYLFIIGYFGHYGYRKTKHALDYLVAGRAIHPFVVVVSYGVTFISTSVIVGFGGAAAFFGMGLLWLTFLSVAVGIIIAFVVFGKRTRKMGHNLDVHTFPELLGRRYNSAFIQGFAGLVIFLFMPLYSAAVLIGAVRFIEATFSAGISYNVSLLIFTLIITAYVLTRGVKGVMYIDAFLGMIMFAGMLALLALTYKNLGGVIHAHQALAALTPQVPEKLAALGHAGWASMPKTGSALWWNLVSTIVLGAGIGVLAQPQLAVRFMTVKSNKEINRGVAIGGIFILVMTGVTFVVGALSNVYFFNNPAFGKISVSVAGGNIDKIIPIYINSTMPVWFVYLFMFALLSAAISTSSFQFHAMGTSISRDFFERVLLEGKFSRYTILITRIGIATGVLTTVFLGYKLPGSVIAAATAIFFSLCANTFLPTYIGTLFWKGMTRAGAVISMMAGFLGTACWLLFVHQNESEAIGLCKFIFNKPTLAVYPWTVIDSIVVVLPVSLLVALLVSAFSRRPSKEHIERCFKHI